MLTVYCIALTLFAYGVSRFLASRYPSPFTTPVFLSSILIILVLIGSGVGARDYEPAKNVLVFLLGPATVALALPIYRHRSRLAAHLAPALGGIAIGSLVTVLTTLALGKLLGLTQPVLASMSTKSVTAPIAIQLAEIIKGDPSLAVAFVIVTRHAGSDVWPGAAYPCRYRKSTGTWTVARHDLARAGHSTGDCGGRSPRRDRWHSYGAGRHYDVLGSAFSD